MILLTTNIDFEYSAFMYIHYWPNFKYRYLLRGKIVIAT